MLAERCAVLDDQAYTWGSGTSFAAPHVAGVAAIYLGQRPFRTPAEFKATLLQASVKDAIAQRELPPGTPNRLLYSQLDDPYIMATTGPAAGPLSQLRGL